MLQHQTKRIHTDKLQRSFNALQSSEYIGRKRLNEQTVGQDQQGVGRCTKTASGSFATFGITYRMRVCACFCSLSCSSAPCSLLLKRWLHSACSESGATRRIRHLFSREGCHESARSYGFFHSRMAGILYGLGFQVLGSPKTAMFVNEEMRWSLRDSAALPRLMFGAFRCLLQTVTPPAGPFNRGLMVLNSGVY